MEDGAIGLGETPIVRNLLTRLCSAYGGLVEQFKKRFVRDQHGVWRCIAPAELQTSNGRVQVAPGAVFRRGTRFMNVDVAELLDAQYEKDRRR
jgi:hypothetical protein